MDGVNEETQVAQLRNVVFWTDLVYTLLKISKNTSRSYTQYVECGIIVATYEMENVGFLNFESSISQNVRTEINDVVQNPTI